MSSPLFLFPTRLIPDIQSIAATLFHQGASQVYVAYTDADLYLGIEPAVSFKKYPGLQPQNLILTPDKLATLPEWGLTV